MKPVRMHPHAFAGSSLLEVLVSISLVAVCLLGVAAAQLAALRDADAQTNRARASWLAVSIVEAMRVPELSSLVLARSRADAAAALPGARISFVDEAGGLSAVAVRWALAPSLSGPRPSASAGACPSTEGQGTTECLALPFASAER